MGVSVSFRFVRNKNHPDSSPPFEVLKYFASAIATVLLPEIEFVVSGFRQLGRKANGEFFME